MIVGARDALARWFDPSLPWGVPGLVANVRALARRRPLELVGALGASAQLLQPVPTMLGDTFASLSVEFLYFGVATHMLWPVLDSAGHWAPSDCVYAVELVGVPDGT